MQYILRMEYYLAKNWHYIIISKKQGLYQRKYDNSKIFLVFTISTQILFAWVF